MGELNDDDDDENINVSSFWQ